MEIAGYTMESDERNIREGQTVKAQSGTSESIRLINGRSVVRVHSPPLFNMKPEHRLKQLRKAATWLDKKCNYNYMPVVANRRGYAEFVAYIYKVEREGKPSVWYCMDMQEQWVPKCIKRICTY